MWLHFYRVVAAYTANPLYSIAHTPAAPAAPAAALHSCLCVLPLPSLPLPTVDTFDEGGFPFIYPGSEQGDEPRGTLTSDPFIIRGESMSFLVGGGCEITEEYVQLPLFVWWLLLVACIGGLLWFNCCYCAC